MAEPVFQRLALIGVGLIGSSLARVARREGIAAEIVGADASARARTEIEELNLCDRLFADAGQAVAGADLVIVCTPIGAYAEVGQAIQQRLEPGAILSDVGSVKQAAIRDLAPIVPDGVQFIPGHPVAGTEHSGPKAGFAELFKGRWCILTPMPGTDEAALDRLAALWRRAGSMVEIMEPAHHDQVLAITSHLPHLIAYCIVGTVTGVEEATQKEVVKFSASGFRDFTRIAASDPVMWRDVFLNNREAVLEMLGRFSEDLAALQRNIRWGEGDKLYELFERTRAIRRALIDAKQA